MKITSRGCGNTWIKINSACFGLLYMPNRQRHRYSWFISQYNLAIKPLSISLKWNSYDIWSNRNKSSKGPHMVHMSTLATFVDGSLFSIAPKKHKILEDIEYLLTVKFQQILFCSSRREVENVSANQRCLSEARKAILVFRLAQKTQTSKRKLKSCFLLFFFKFRLGVA